MKTSLLLADILAHPLTKGLSLDDPRTTELRTTIIRNKGFLKQIYESWYRLLASQIPAGYGSVLEVGSAGGGFLNATGLHLVKNFRNGRLPAYNR